MTADNVLRRAELLLQAKNYSGSGDWLDESGNGHDAQLGSTSGSDTNDPLFKAYDGTQYTYLPGTSGNYMLSADTNLLDADTAHLQQSVGQWTAFVPPEASLALEASTAAVFGDNIAVLSITGNTISGRGLIEPPRPAGGGGYTVSAGTTYSFAASTVSPTKTVAVNVLWWDVSNGFISQSTVGTVPAGSSLVEVAGQVVAPTGAVNATFQIGIGDAQNPVSGDEVWLDAVLWGASGVSTFVPSIRIVGDLDIEAKVAATDWTPSADDCLVGAGTTSSYQFGIDTLGYLKFTIPGIVVYDSTAATGVTDGDAAVVQMQFDDSANTVTFYVDGVQLGTPVTVPFSLAVPTGQGLGVGANPLGGSLFAGDIYYVEVRDGIDGPVVARYDASDAVEPFATQTGSVDGRTWTYNRSSSGLVSTVVDRDMWLLSTDDYFEIADSTAFDWNVEDATIMAVFKPSLTSGAYALVANKALTAAEGTSIFTSTTTVAGSFSDGVNEGYDSQASAIAAHTLATAALRYDSAINKTELFIDGVGSGSPGTAVVGDNSPAASLYVGSALGVANFLEGQIVAVALFREALSDNAVKAIGNTLVYELADPTGLHGDALFNWLQVAEAGNFTSLEVVGALNELNGTTGVEYSQARATYLGIDTI